MEHVVRTFWAAQLQSAQAQGLPFTAPEYTTLNEKLGILPVVALTPGTYPIAKYFAIGNGGHDVIAGANGIPVPKIRQHSAVDAALFNQLPFVLRQTGDDIAPAERARYGLRKEITVGGTTYVAYYLRRIDTSLATIALEKRTVVDGVTSVASYVPTAANLNPVPVNASNSGVNVVSGDYVTCTTQLSLAFSASDISELLNVSNILYNSDDYAIISEIAFCSGYDKVINVTAATGNFNFNDAIQVQANCFIACHHLAKYLSQGLNKTIDVGSNYPLYNLS